MEAQRGTRSEKLCCQLPPPAHSRKRIDMHWLQNQSTNCRKERDQNKSLGPEKDHNDIHRLGLETVPCDARWFTLHAPPACWRRSSEFDKSSISFHKTKNMKTVATGAHAEGHVEENVWSPATVSVSSSKLSSRPHSSGQPPERVTYCSHHRVPMQTVTKFANVEGSCVVKIVLTAESAKTCSQSASAPSKNRTMNQTQHSDVPKSLQWSEVQM